MASLGKAWRGRARRGKGINNKRRDMETINFKYTSKYSKDVIDEILLVKNSSGLTAENLVARAVDRSSPLHKLFEWDNKVCGELYREHQARMIISDIKIILDDKEIYAFENISLDVDDISVREYYDAIEIMEDSDKRAQIIKKAVRQLIYWKDKYQTYREFSGIVKEVERLQYAMSQ